MRLLVAAMQQNQRRIFRAAPFEKVKAQAAQHDLPRTIGDVRGVGDAEIGGGLQQAGKFLGRRHVVRRAAFGGDVEIHGAPPEICRILRRGGDGGNLGGGVGDGKVFFL